MLSRIISVVSNDIFTDNRVHKIALSLEANGYHVTVIGRRRKHAETINTRPYNVRRFQLVWNRGPLFYANLNIRYFLYLLRAKVDIILANDLDTMPACYLAAVLRKKKLVFDSHELFSEVPELMNRRRVRKVWQMLENYYVKRVRLGFTVSNSIAQFYQNKYGVEMEVIRNVAAYRHRHEVVEKVRPNEVKVIIYQGVLNLGRGLELLIRSMVHLPGVQLWIIGTGDIDDKLKDLSAQMNITDRVEFKGRVSIYDLWKYTSQADVGVSLEEDLGLNYQFSLPNKLFDYIQARIPVVVSDLPEMSLVVSSYAIGRVLYQRTPEALAVILHEMLEESGKTDMYRSGLELAANELCWEMEEIKLIKIFKRAENRSAAGNA